MIELIEVGSGAGVRLLLLDPLGSRRCVEGHVEYTDLARMTGGMWGEPARCARTSGSRGRSAVSPLASQRALDEGIQ